MLGQLSITTKAGDNRTREESDVVIGITESGDTSGRGTVQLAVLATEIADLAGFGLDFVAHRVCATAVRVQMAARRRAVARGVEMRFMDVVHWAQDWVSATSRNWVLGRGEIRLKLTEWSERRGVWKLGEFNFELNSNIVGVPGVTRVPHSGTLPNLASSSHVSFTRQIYHTGTVQRATD